MKSTRKERVESCGDKFLNVSDINRFPHVKKRVGTFKINAVARM